MKKTSVKAILILGTSIFTAFSVNVIRNMILYTGLVDYMVSDNSKGLYASVVQFLSIILAIIIGSIVTLIMIKFLIVEKK